MNYNSSTPTTGAPYFSSPTSYNNATNGEKEQLSNKK